MQRVFVLDKHKNPLMPTTPKRARELIAEGRARIMKLYPFTIVLIDRVGGDTQKVEWKCDPGSKESGMALVAHFPEQGKVVLWAGVIQHRGVNSEYCTLLQRKNGYQFQIGGSRADSSHG
jgi:hypothetical protein